jgi:hypothetical protein
MPGNHRAGAPGIGGKAGAKARTVARPATGKRRSPRARTGQPRASASDRGLGTEADRCGGERRCPHPPVRTALVDLAVWQAVGPWLVPPERLAEA